MLADSLILMTSPLQVMVHALKSMVISPRGRPSFRRFSSHLKGGIAALLPQVEDWKLSRYQFIQVTLTLNLAQHLDCQDLLISTAPRLEETHMTTSKAFPCGLLHQCSRHAHFRFSCIPAMIMSVVEQLC